MYENWTTDGLRAELKYLKKKRKFIARANYLPMTSHNYQLAANQSYRGVVGISEDRHRMKLHCEHWQPVPQANPLPERWMAAHRFCGTCADAKYKEIMLAEIDAQRNAIRAILGPSPWWIRILGMAVVIVLGIGLSLQAWASWHGIPHPVGAFDPRADEYSDGSCP